MRVANRNGQRVRRVLLRRGAPGDLERAEAAGVLVVNKPAGLVVHPGAGNPDRTLVNGLLAYRAELQLLPRAGIVHRLDFYPSTELATIVERSSRILDIEVAGDAVSELAKRARGSATSRSFSRRRSTSTRRKMSSSTT